MNSCLHNDTLKIETFNFHFAFSPPPLSHIYSHSSHFLTSLLHPPLLFVKCHRSSSQDALSTPAPNNTKTPTVTTLGSLPHIEQYDVWESMLTKLRFVSKKNQKRPQGPPSVDRTLVKYETNVDKDKLLAVYIK